MKFYCEIFVIDSDDCIAPRSVSQETVVVGQTNPSVITDVAQFAPLSSVFSATFSVTNLGTTRVPSAQLSIFWPLNTPNDGDHNYYYLYPIQTNDGVR